MAVWDYDPKLFADDPENYRLEQNPLLVGMEATLERKIANLDKQLTIVRAHIQFVEDNILSDIQAKILITIQQVYKISRTSVGTETLQNHLKETKARIDLAIKTLLKQKLIVNVGDRRNPRWLPTLTGASVAALIFERNPKIL